MDKNPFGEEGEAVAKFFLATLQVIVFGLALLLLALVSYE